MGRHPIIPDFHAWKLLCYLESCPNVSQRGAARVLGINVKICHEVVTRLVSKGWIHIHKHNARRWDYILTQDGLREKARLTVEFLDFSMQFYRQARESSATLCQSLASQGEAHVSLLGTNGLSEITAISLQEADLQIAKIYDAAPTDEQTFLNHPVHPIEAITYDNGPPIIVCLYEPSSPMAHRYLPPTAPRSRRYHWIFA